MHPYTALRVFPLELPMAREEMRWTLDASTGNITVNIKFRVLGAEDCIVIKDSSLGKTSKKTKAIFDVELTSLKGNLQKKHFYYISDKPKKYVLLFSCTHRDTIDSKVCNGGFSIYIVVSKNPPDNLSWKHIENELMCKLGLQMRDDRNKFHFTGDQCPDEI